MNKVSFGKIGVFLSAFLVAILAVYLYSPTLSTHAVGETRRADTSEVGVKVKNVLAISVDKNELGLNATIGSFAHGTVNVGVATNSRYGYTLSIEDFDDNTSLTSDSSSNIFTSNFSGIKSSEDMEDNTWGWSIKEAGYYSVPVNGNPLAVKRTEHSTADQYEMTPVEFGVKVGTDVQAGTYEDVVVFTAYVNGQDGLPTDGSEVSDPRDEAKPQRESMQDFDCSSLENFGDTTILEDLRDENEYTVFKAKDGKCWMSQNLRIAGATISSDKSDVVTDFNLPEPAQNFTVTFDNAQVFDSGNQEYGMYYNYTAASAGTISGSSNTNNSTYSICPKGWTIPSKTQWENMLSLEGADNTAAGLAKAKAAPISLDYSGYIDSNGNRVYTQGASGNFWSATAQNYASHYAIQIDDWNKVITTYSFRRVGYSVRCMSR